MLADRHSIWILDNDPACFTLYQQTLGLQHDVRNFKSVAVLTKELASDQADSRPHLLIADPEMSVGSFSDTLREYNESKSPLPKFPEFVIVSRIDELDAMRFYLKTGARDYILKPLRPNEIVAKIERVMYQVSNREVFFLRNDLDGIQIPDLTFREHQMLTIFLNRPNRSVNRDDLFDSIWTKTTVNRKTLDVHLFNLRRKLRSVGYDVLYQNQIFSLCRTVTEESP